MSKTLRPQLSVIIVTWNTADITLKCVRTLKQYLKNISYEIIVADNASTDDTVSKLKKEGGIVLIENDQNYGFSRGINLAAVHSRADYLFFLNSDMELLDNKVSEMLTFLKKHPQIGLIGPKLLYPDKRPQSSVFPPQTPLNAVKEYWFGQKTYSIYVPSATEPIAVSSISGGAVIINRQLFNQIGGWDERYYFYFEDLELCRQIKKRGYQIYYYPQCQLIHHHGASGKNLINSGDQWRRLIPGSKIYHGLFEHYLLFLIIWSSQKWQKLFGKKSI